MAICLSLSKYKFIKCCYFHTTETRLQILSDWTELWLIISDFLGFGIFYIVSGLSANIKFTIQGSKKILGPTRPMGQVV